MQGLDHLVCHDEILHFGKGNGGRGCAITQPPFVSVEQNPGETGRSQCRGSRRGRPGNRARGRGCSGLAVFANPASLLRCEKGRARPKSSTLLTRENFQKKHEHHTFPLCNGAKGRQEGESPPHERCVEEGVEVDPGDVPAVILLSGYDLGTKVVPVKEPLTTKDI